jgi:arylsulfatase A-like enzyme
MGRGVKPGRYNGNVSITDIAPTLSTLLGIEMPSGAEGRALSEIFSDN